MSVLDDEKQDSSIIIRQFSFVFYVSVILHL